MNKMLIIFFVSILILSAFTITACNPRSEGNNSVNSSTSSEEPFDNSSYTSMSSVGNNSSSNSTSMSSVGSNSSSSSSMSSATDDSSSTSMLPEDESGVVIPHTDPGDTSTPLGQAIASINMIGSVTENNYASKYQLITNAQSKCSAISDKSLIPNYSYLLAAREAFDIFKETGDLIKFLDDFNNLPSVITSENYLSFYTILDRYSNDLSDSQKGQIPDEVKNKLNELKTVVDSIPKPAPTPTTTLAVRTESDLGFIITWDFTNSYQENNTVGSYLSNGYNDSGLSYRAYGTNAYIRKTDLTMNAGASIVVPVGEYNGNIKIVPTGSSDNRHFALETGGDYSNTASIKPGTITTDYYKKLWSKSASQPTDTHRGPQDFNFTVDDLTLVGAPFHDLCLILVAQGGIVRIDQLVLTRTAI